PLVCSLSCLPSSAVPRRLHSFPTRRSSDLEAGRGARAGRRAPALGGGRRPPQRAATAAGGDGGGGHRAAARARRWVQQHRRARADRKSTRLNSSHQIISYAVFCLKKKKKTT